MVARQGKPCHQRDDKCPQKRPRRRWVDDVRYLASHTGEWLRMEKYRKDLGPGVDISKFTHDDDDDLSLIVVLIFLSWLLYLFKSLKYQFSSSFSSYTIYKKYFILYIDTYLCHVYCKNLHVYKRGDWKATKMKLKFGNYW